MRESGEKVQKAGDLKASPVKFIAEVIPLLHQLDSAYKLLRAREITKINKGS